MNTVHLFSSLTDKQPKEAAWEAVATEIRSNQLAATTAEYRTCRAGEDEARRQGDATTEAACANRAQLLKQRLPGFNAWAHLQGGRTKAHIRGYRPYMMVDLDHLPEADVTQVAQLVGRDEHVTLCYTTVSGRGVRAIVRMEEPVTADNYRDAWLTANQYIARLAGGVEFDVKCSDPTRLSALCHDPQAVFRPDAVPLPVRQQPQPSQARLGKGAGRPCKAAKAAVTVRRMVEQEGTAYTDGQHNAYASRCIYWMNRFGVPQEECLAWAADAFADYEATHRGALQGIVRSVYQNHTDEHATCRLTHYREEKQQKARLGDVEAWVGARYRLRRNLLSHQVEWQALKGDGSGRVDDRFVNSLWRAMQLEGITVDVNIIHSLLSSDFVEDFHPFRHWITQLPPWDGVTDYIGRFLSMVHCRHTSADEFDHFARRWLVAMVASVLDEETVNQEILTFIGPQGTYKSSFMLHILPPHLRDFFTTKTSCCSLDKDDLIMLAENILISLEEIDSLTTKELNQLKAYTVKPHIKERPAYGRHKLLMPRVASLCATGNNPTFLTDDTGNRRWLTFEIERIDNPWEADIPYEGIYAQCVALYRQGFRYWFSDHEVHELNQRNRRFEAPNPAEEMVLTHFFQPRSPAELRYLTATQIAARFAPWVKISPTKISRAMTALGFEMVRTHSGKFWKVAERQPAEIGYRLPDGKRSDDAEGVPF